MSRRLKGGEPPRRGKERSDAECLDLRAKDEIKLKEHLRLIRKLINNQILINTMATDMVTIPREEYERLKSLDKEIDWELVDDFREGLEELKQGKVIKC